MKRTQIYLTKEDKKAIEKLSDERGTTQSNINREAFNEYIIKKKINLKRSPAWILPISERIKELFLISANLEMNGKNV